MEEKIFKKGEVLSYFNLYTNELEEIFFDTYTNNTKGYNSIDMPKRYGTGACSLYATEHLNFSSIYFALQNNISIQSTNEESVFLITVMYSGNTYIKEDNKYGGMDLLNHDVYLSFYPKDISYSSILPKNQKLQVFSFFFSKEQLINYLIEFNAIALIHKINTIEKMEQAFENLKNLDMSIWEIAHEAGYENVSNFINVFRKKFGKTPGDMRKERSFCYSK